MVIGSKLSEAADESVYLALFKVTAIADLDSPERALEWAHSLLDDEQLRAAFVAGVESELASSKRRRAGRVIGRFDRRPLDPEMPVLHFGRPERRGNPTRAV